jgi:tRNA pseudouridine32 synthase/23S rRNA pseudouridine746 synthase
MASTPYRPPAHHGLSILYLCEQLIVVDKPSGLLSVPGRGAGKEDCLSSRVQAEYPDALIVHRLDMGTSGIVVMGRGARAQRELSILFQERRVHKRYQALVAAAHAPSTGPTAQSSRSITTGAGHPGPATACSTSTRRARYRASSSSR